MRVGLPQLTERPIRHGRRVVEVRGFGIEGECLLLVEGEERRLGPWDYFHCAPGKCG